MFAFPLFLRNKQILKSGIFDGKWARINTTHTGNFRYMNSEWGHGNIAGCLQIVGGSIYASVN